MGFEIRIDVDYPGHPKTRLLMSLIGPEADVYPIRLWIEAAKYAPEGVIKGVATLEQWCSWRGKPNQLFDALCRAGFIEHQKRNSRILIHNWRDRSGHYVILYMEKKRKQRVKYARMKDAEDNILPQDGGRLPQGGESFPPEKESSVRPDQTRPDHRRPYRSAASPDAGAGKGDSGDAYLEEISAVYGFCSAPKPETRRSTIRDLIRQGVPSEAIRSAPDRWGTGWDFYEYVKRLRDEKRTRRKEEPVEPKCKHPEDKLKTLRTLDNEALVECQACKRRDWVPKNGKADNVSVHAIRHIPKA